MMSCECRNLSSAEGEGGGDLQHLDMQAGSIRSEIEVIAVAACEGDGNDDCDYDGCVH